MKTLAGCRLYHKNEISAPANAAATIASSPVEVANNTSAMAALASAPKPPASPSRPSVTFTAFAAANSATTEEARVKAYQDVETGIVEKLCGIIPLYQDARSYVISDKLGGVVANGTIDAGLPGNYAPENWYVTK